MTYVAPFTGAWIEMSQAFFLRTIFSPVAPFMGAWIEILDTLQVLANKK